LALVYGARIEVFFVFRLSKVAVEDTLLAHILAQCVATALKVADRPHLYELRVVVSVVVLRVSTGPRLLLVSELDGVLLARQLRVEGCHELKQLFLDGLGSIAETVLNDSSVLLLGLLLLSELVLDLKLPLELLSALLLALVVLEVHCKFVTSDLIVDGLLEKLKLALIDVLIVLFALLLHDQAADIVVARLRSRSVQGLLGECQVPYLSEVLILVSLLAAQHLGVSEALCDGSKCLFVSLDYIFSLRVPRNLISVRFVKHQHVVVGQLAQQMRGLRLEDVLGRRHGKLSVVEVLL
jgi:hypothetical protein